MSEARGRLIGVSLKMYMGLARTRTWMQDLARMAATGLPDSVALFVIPTFVSIADTRAALAGARVDIGAQDVFWEDSGAYTGEVSAPMLAEAGCRYVEIGHAERRRIFGETDEIVGLKTAATVRAGLIPVLCVGETTRMEPAEAVAECARQIAAATAAIPADAPIVIAYEPVWAIGAPAPAAPEHIIGVARGLRDVLADRSDASLIYGGSAGPGLLGTLGDAVDGLFLGRFAHDIEALGQVLREAAEPVH